MEKTTTDRAVPSVTIMLTSSGAICGVSADGGVSVVLVDEAVGAAPDDGVSCQRVGLMTTITFGRSGEGGKAGPISVSKVAMPAAGHA